MKPACKTCKFSMENDENSIVCHRYPPAITKAEGLNITCFFPILSPLSWCGEWKYVEEPEKNPQHH